jgi:arginyl-tRNA synthetase
LKQQLEQLLLQALGAAGDLPSPDATAVAVERTRDPRHGDFSSNVALRLAKSARRNPRALAQSLIDALPSNPLIAYIELVHF